jgi:hypothetical protein
LVSKKIHACATIAGALIVLTSLFWAGEALVAYRDNKLAPHPVTHQLIGNVSASEPASKPPFPEEASAAQEELRRLNDILFKQPPVNP